MAAPPLDRLETSLVDEAARSASTRRRCRQHWELVAAWASSRGLELSDYSALDDHLCGFLRESFLGGRDRSFAVGVVQGAKFAVPAELGRGRLWRARRAVALWDCPCGPWLAGSSEDAAAEALALRTVLRNLFGFLGLITMGRLQRVHAKMPEAVDDVVELAFGSRSVPRHGSAGDLARQEGPAEPPSVGRPQPALAALAAACRRHLGQRLRAGHAGLRFVVQDSPGRLQLEALGVSAFQHHGRLSLFGDDVAYVSMDTFGLWFGGASSEGQRAGMALRRTGNLSTVAGKASDQENAMRSEVASLAQCFRDMLDPASEDDAWRLLNPKTLSILTELFPDGKYDVAFFPQCFEHYDEHAQYAQPDAGPRDAIRGSPQECYLCRANAPIHLLRTQAGLDHGCVDGYCAVLQHALSEGSRRRPTALVFDHFLEGDIAKGRPWVQARRAEAAEPDYARGAPQNGRAWVLLDGHHKVEAAARLRCSLNFLVFSAAAAPYTPLRQDDALANTLTCRAPFPALVPSTSAALKASWAETEGCRHFCWVLSSSRTPRRGWLETFDCGCFDHPTTAPPSSGPAPP